MELVASLFFLNQFWVASACLGSNIPYWSLSYEFLYYCLFAVYAFAPRRWLLLALAGLVVGPKVLLLLPCWAFGVVVFSLGKRPLPRHLALLLAAGGLALFIAIVYSKVGNKFVTWRVEALIGPQWTEWLGHSTAFISDTLLGAMFAAHLWGVTSLFHNVSVSRALLSPLQKIASSTFAIYLIHYPCLIFFTALSLRTMGTVNGIFVGLSSLLIPVILTWPTEAFKRHLRRFLLLRF
jgi:peptidoglycan/LPS O-acetylase OafA/YrhL